MATEKRIQQRVISSKSRDTRERFVRSRRSLSWMRWYQSPRTCPHSWATGLNNCVSCCWNPILGHLPKLLQLIKGFCERLEAKEVNSQFLYFQWEKMYL